MEIIANLDLVEADFAQHYGIDLSKPKVWNKSWHWFETRLVGLMTMPKNPFIFQAAEHRYVLNAPVNRLQYLLDPIEFPDK